MQTASFHTAEDPIFVEFQNGIAEVRDDAADDEGGEERDDIAENTD